MRYGDEQHMDPFASRDRETDLATPSLLRTIPGSSPAMTSLRAALRSMADSEQVPEHTRETARAVLAGRTSLEALLANELFTSEGVELDTAVESVDRQGGSEQMRWA